MYKVFLHGSSASIGLDVKNTPDLITLIDTALQSGKRIEIWGKEEINKNGD